MDGISGRFGRVGGIFVKGYEGEITACVVRGLVMWNDWTLIIEYRWMV